MKAATVARTQTKLSKLSPAPRGHSVRFRLPQAASNTVGIGQTGKCFHSVEGRAAAPRTQIDSISTYVQYADVLEAPSLLHEMVGVQLIATVLNRNGVFIPLGHIRIPLDLWMVLLTLSGGGRAPSSAFLTRSSVGQDWRRFGT